VIPACASAFAFNPSEVAIAIDCSCVDERTSTCASASARVGWFRCTQLERARTRAHCSDACLRERVRRVGLRDFRDEFTYCEFRNGDGATELDIRSWQILGAPEIATIFKTPVHSKMRVV
jgi:hypothetical protein